MVEVCYHTSQTIDMCPAADPFHPREFSKKAALSLESRLARPARRRLPLLRKGLRLRRPHTCSCIMRLVPSPRCTLHAVAQPVTPGQTLVSLHVSASHQFVHNGSAWSFLVPAAACASIATLASSSPSSHHTPGGEPFRGTVGA
jgi:hypothetical protein